MANTGNPLLDQIIQSAGSSSSWQSGSTQPDVGQPTLPTHQNLPKGAPDLSNIESIFRAILAQQAAESKASREFSREEAEAARKFYPERAQVDYQYWQQREDIARRNALERMEEKTRRDVELKTIDAWRGVTEAQINRDAYLAQGMMQLSATLGMPNPNVMQANAGIIQQGIGAFRPGQPVF